MRSVGFSTEDHTSELYFFLTWSDSFFRNLEISPAAEKLAAEGDFQLAGYVVDAQKEQTRAPRLVFEVDNDKSNVLKFRFA